MQVWFPSLPTWGVQSQAACGHLGKEWGMDMTTPSCRNACQAPCPDEALVSAAFVKASCISVPGMGSGQKWGVNPNRIPESWSSEAGEAWSSRKDVARLPWGAKGCWSSGGGWCLGPCHSVPPFVICEMGSRPPLAQGSCGGSIVLTGIESSVQGAWCVVGAQYMAAKSTSHAVGSQRA